MLAESRDGKVTYEGGSRKCMVVKEGIRVEELMKMVREMTGNDMLEEKLWYSLKYDREMLVAVEGDSDMKVILKGNDEHGYMYVARNSGLVTQAHQRGAVCEGRVRDCCEGKQIPRSGRMCDDGVEVGAEGGNNQAGVKYNCRSLRGEGGDEEATKEDDVEKLGKKMDKHKIETLKWKNGVGERIEQKLADTYKKMDCITAVECYSLILGEYSVELTNSR
ncbi:hypothetical protein Cgig2_018415 [Carnegiea gigantea]|uniref:PB1 domain-containing protein n=1 Tax=Carnegiea gigantea TaxID=171969 RepID=A0A9Q1JTG2_9CARY|nr:hypothetical protein Cgig2_018415 [Carnegiea gigantea]